MSDPAQLRVSNQELATVREAMRELGRLLDQLDAGQLVEGRPDPPSMSGRVRSAAAEIRCAYRPAQALGRSMETAADRSSAIRGARSSSSAIVD